MFSLVSLYVLRFTIDAGLTQYSANYVLCSSCFDKKQNSNKGSDIHEDGHLFVKMSTPASAQQTLLYFLFPKVVKLPVV
jgi:hypothetical protein